MARCDMRTSMARMGKLTGRSVDEAGEAEEQRGWRRDSGSFFRRVGASAMLGRGGSSELYRAWGGEKANGAGRKTNLPRSPSYKGRRGNRRGYHATRIAYGAATLWLWCGSSKARVEQTQGGPQDHMCNACVVFEEARGSGYCRSFTQRIRARRRSLT